MRDTDISRILSHNNNNALGSFQIPTPKAMRIEDRDGNRDGNHGIGVSLLTPENLPRRPPPLSQNRCLFMQSAVTRDLPAEDKHKDSPVLTEYRPTQKPSARFLRPRRNTA